MFSFEHMDWCSKENSSVFIEKSGKGLLIRVGKTPYTKGTASAEERFSGHLGQRVPQGLKPSSGSLVRHG